MRHNVELATDKRVTGALQLPGQLATRVFISYNIQCMFLGPGITESCLAPCTLFRSPVRLVACLVFSVVNHSKGISLQIFPNIILSF